MNAKSSIVSISQKRDTGLIDFSKKISDSPNRLNFVLNDSDYAELISLQDELKPSSMTELFRTAVRVLRYLIDIHQAGGAVYVKRKGSSKYEELIMFSRHPQ